jgi:formylglycine-generating enzyme required for sulfatase activity
MLCFALNSYKTILNKIEDSLADIFLSYAREDLAKARQLAVALETQGWSVFWDRTALLAGQDFEEVIEQAIKQAGCMIVAWSAASKRSDWVRGEANIGRERKILVPILFETIEPPIAFRALHTENFAGWNGDMNSDEFNKLQRAVTRLVSSGTGRDQTFLVDTNKPAPASATNEVASDSKTPVVSIKTFIEPQVVVIPAGRFQMGSDKGQRERPIHTVNIAKPFSIAKYLITFDEYELFVKAMNRELPSDEGWGRGKRPVINVSWEDANAYASWLSEISGKSYRLLTEAEWEYAVRANTTTDYYWGGQAMAKDFAWYYANSDSKTHPVGQKKPNAFGLYDMSGNVWQWVQDCWHDNYDKAPDNGSAWQAENNGYCSRRVLRGGYCARRFLGQRPGPFELGVPDRLRSASRDWNNPVYRNDDIGFRLAKD